MAVWFLASLVAATLVPGQRVEGAVFEPHEFKDPGDEDRYKHLINELRCLVCQNQSLADSNAELAGDLRRQVYTMIRDDASDEQILDFMVSRYGDFVLYRPPVKPTTVLLWTGPFLLVVGALLFLGIQIRRRGKAQPSAVLTDTERQRLAHLLDEDSDHKGDT